MSILKSSISDLIYSQLVVTAQVIGSNTGLPHQMIRCGCEILHRKQSTFQEQISQIW
jgi:hypothetical protein